MRPELSEVPNRWNAVVLGGGFFGVSLALALRERLDRVLLLEKESDLLTRASYSNQARVHNGYHYPRSILTAFRSRVNFPRFTEVYAESVYRTFDAYYGIGRTSSNVTAGQFKAFCDRIGARAEPAPPRIKALFDSDLVEEVFEVQELAFDSTKLRAALRRELDEACVEVWLEARAERLRSEHGEELTVELVRGGGEESVVADRVYNCAYSQINQVLAASGLPLIPLKHELTEMPLLDVPEALRSLGITIMCGPFFSLMPFPALGTHSLHHVRYTPHCSWNDVDEPYRDAHRFLDERERRSAYGTMIADAKRYLPEIARSRQVGSIWEVKTVLPSSEADDSRPILFKEDHGLPNLTCVLGGKIDNVFDMLDELEATN